MLRLGAVEGWVVTHDGETLKTGFKNDFEAVGWLHRRQSQSVDWAVQHEGYDIVLVKDGKVVYSYKQEAKKRHGLAGHRFPEGSEGTAYVDRHGNTWEARWYSRDEGRHYTIAKGSTIREVVDKARREGFKVVIAEPHKMGDLKTRSKHPVPVWPEFVDAYLQAALWASSTPDEVPLDVNYTVEDFAQEAIDKAIEESNAFIRANRNYLRASSKNRAQHGHDFFLTRNLHGAGFQDRGYGSFGDHLAEASRAFGQANAYVGRDGKLRF